MKLTKWLLCVAFIAHVKIPFGIAKAYNNVRDVEIMPMGITLKLVLEDDKVVYVPALFTIIEEK